MKVKTEPLLGAVMFAVVLLVVGSLYYVFVMYQSIQDMLEMPIFDPAYLETLEQNSLSPTDEAALQTDLEGTMTNLITGSTVGGLISCLTWLIASIGAGVLYPILYKRSEPEIVGAVSGGALSGALGNVIGYLIISIMSTLLLMPLLSNWANQMAALTESAGGPPPSFGGIFVTYVAVGTICGTLLMGGIGAVLGAIGGAIGDAVTN